jgi:hypothetical protein
MLPCKSSRHYCDGDDMDCDTDTDTGAPLKRYRTHSDTHSLTPSETLPLSHSSVVNIPWPMLYPKPSAADEIEMEKILVTSRHESCRGVELPQERQQLIEREAFNRGFLLT